MVDWIIEGKLAGSSRPDSIQVIRNWKKEGIKSIVNLLEPYEIRVPLEKIKNLGLNVLWVPIPDMTAPTIRQLRTIVAWINKEINNNNPVVVHCLAGLGRTGTILAAYLTFKDMLPKDAISYVRKKIPGAIMTQEQYNIIFHFYNAIKVKEK
ncbi:MAG: dual specificity protein phosphatase family protein [Candidatus Korarchaeota archaeon]|nr:dual specificity protein phosphatase family protein [Candidatus Korarchaeota archaeon]